MDWYPVNYYIQPYYASAPTIHYWDQTAFTYRKRKYWNAAWTRALQRWAAVGLDLVFHPGPIGCHEPGLTCEVIDVPPRNGSGTQLQVPPEYDLHQVDIHTSQNHVQGRTN